MTCKALLLWLLLWLLSRADRRARGYLRLRLGLGLAFENLVALSACTFFVELNQQRAKHLRIWVGAATFCNTFDLCVCARSFVCARAQVAHGFIGQVPGAIRGFLQMRARRAGAAEKEKTNPFASDVIADAGHRRAKEFGIAPLAPIVRNSPRLLSTQPRRAGGQFAARAPPSGDHACTKDPRHTLTAPAFATGSCAACHRCRA